MTRRKGAAPVGTGDGAEKKTAAASSSPTASPEAGQPSFDDAPCQIRQARRMKTRDRYVVELRCGTRLVIDAITLKQHRLFANAVERATGRRPAPLSRKEWLAQRQAAEWQHWKKKKQEGREQDGC